MKIILDGMGGDNAPRAIVDGAAQAVRMYPDLEIVITGDPGLLEPMLREASADTSRIKIAQAFQVVLMTDEPVRAVRDKPDSSMMRALSLLAEDPKAMLISAGNTGALVAGATLLTKRIPGVKRPALAPVIPTRTGAAVLIDGGANADCKASYLAQFGIMGSIFMQKVHGIPEPRVALVNNGSEPGKGTSLTKEAFKLLQKAPVRFVGNVEGRDLLSGQYDVLVTDGFTGNILLKFTEGCTKTLLGMLKQYISESLPAKLGAVLMKGAFGRLKSRMDYKEYGGALLLGVNGGVMKAHGSSDGKAICAAITTARTFLEGDVVGAIASEIHAIEEKARKEKEAKEQKDALAKESKKGQEKAEGQTSKKPAGKGSEPVAKKQPKKASQEKQASRKKQTRSAKEGEAPDA